MKAHDIAYICHEANRAYCRAIGDNSQDPWATAPQWQKDSAVNGVMLVMSYPDVTLEETHQNWVDHKKSEGWTYGLEKDPVAKTHPCIVMYHQLPPEQKRKDALFRAIVLALM